MRQVVMTPTYDGGYIVYVPSLPGCYGQGETPEEALKNAQAAIDTFTQDLIARGEPVPEYQPMPGRPVAVDVTAGHVWVTFHDGRKVGLPVHRFQWLDQAPPEQQRNCQLSEIDLYWPDLDEGLDIEWFTGEWTLDGIR